MENNKIHFLMLLMPTITTLALGFRLERWKCKAAKVCYFSTHGTQMAYFSTPSKND